MTLGQIFKLMAQHWPFPVKRAAVVSGYRALATSYPQTLADIGLRNHVFGPLPETSDAIALARAAGRQECALEIFSIARADPALLHKVLESKPVETGR